MSYKGIVEMETVLPDGTIANISDYSNPDLFRAMKGSGKNFGKIFEIRPRIHLTSARYCD